MEDGVVSAMYGTTLRGLPNHHRIASAEPLGATRTAEIYRMFTIDGTYPLLVEDREHGAAIPCEIYRIDNATWAAKVANEPPGLVVGVLELEDGSQVVGMLADPTWLARKPAAEDITAYGGWAAYAADRP
jgi:hypothetical protein